MKVSSVREMRRLDSRAMTEFGIPDHILMENAGQAVYYEILQQLGTHGLHFVVVGGPGNNGGDSFVVARKLHSSGAQVQVLVFADVNRYVGPARMNYEMIHSSGIRILVDPDSDQIAESLAGCDAVVDGLLGTGLTREVGGRFREVIELVNGSGKPVFAVDIPSGVDGDTGQVRGVSIRAETTITFGLPKRGNLLYPGTVLGGRLVVTHISFPPELLDDNDIYVSVNEPSRLPARHVGRRDCTYGEVLLIAGSRDYFGAAGFAALSLLGTGVGCARLAVPNSIVSVLADLENKIVFAPQKDTDSGSIALGAREELLELSRSADFVVLGPGLSLVEETQELVRRLATDIEKPLLIDSDGTTAVMETPDVIRRRSGATVLMMQTGEMSNIAGLPILDIQSDLIPVLQDVAEDLGAIIVLKGDHLLIGGPDRRAYINPRDNSGRSSAGSSDVLTGTIAAMYSLGLPIEEAVQTGGFLYGFAGDLVASDKDTDKIDTRWLLEHLPAAAESYRDNYADITADFCGTIKVI